MTLKKLKIVFQWDQQKCLKKNEKHLNSLLITAYFTDKHGFSFEVFGNMWLQQNNGLDMGNTYLTNKACIQFISFVREGFRLSDGSTDAWVLEEEAMYVRYILNGSALTQFSVVKNPDKASAPGKLKFFNELLLGLK